MMKLIGAFCECAHSPKSEHSFGGRKGWYQFQAVSGGFSKVGSLLSPFCLKMEADPFSKTLWVFSLRWWTVSKVSVIIVCL